METTKTIGLMLITFVGVAVYLIGVNYVVARLAGEFAPLALMVSIPLSLYGLDKFSHG